MVAMETGGKKVTASPWERLSSDTHTLPWPPISHPSSSIMQIGEGGVNERDRDREENDSLMKRRTGWGVGKGAWNTCDFR